MAYPYIYQPGGYGAQSQMLQNFGNVMQPAMAQPQPTTNKIFAVSAEDAMSRFAMPNSVMIYLLQDETVLYEVYTDGQGKKSIRTRSLVDAAPEKPVEYATKDEVAEIRQIVEAIRGGNS